MVLQTQTYRQNKKCDAFYLTQEYIYQNVINTALNAFMFHVIVVEVEVVTSRAVALLVAEEAAAVLVVLRKTELNAR